MMRIHSTIPTPGLERKITAGGQPASSDAGERKPVLDLRAMPHYRPIQSLQFAGAAYVYPPRLNIVNQLRERAFRSPKALALGVPAAFTPDGKPVQLTNRELYDGMLQMAGVLKNKFNIRPGDTVATIETNSPDFFKLFYGTLALGARLAPVNMQALADKALGHQKLTHMINLSNCKVLFLGDTIFRNPNFSDLKKLNLLEPLLKSGPKRFIGRHKMTGLCKKMHLADYCPALRKTGPKLERMEYLIENLPAGLPVVSPKERDRALRHIKPLSENDLVLNPGKDEPALLLYTSGTTSVPKGVPITHSALVHNTQALAECVQELTDADKQLLGLPMYHIFGLSLYLAAAQKGMRNILLPDLTEALAKPGKLVDTIQREKITFMGVVPKILNAITGQATNKPETLATIRFMVSGGEKLPRETFNRFKAAMPQADLWEGYGMTETGVLTLNKTGEYGHVGSPINPRITVELRKKNAQDIGEIWVKTPSGGSPYLGVKPEQVAEVFKPDGWLNTGDLGVFDGPNLRIVGREKEIIKRNGEILAPDDFDALLTKHLPVRDALTFAYHPNGANGEEKIVSIVLLNDEASRKNEDGRALQARLQTLARGEQLSYKYIPHYILALPQKNFPEGFISVLDKKQLKNARAYLDTLIKDNIIRFEKDGITVTRPEGLRVSRGSMPR